MLIRNKPVRSTIQRCFALGLLLAAVAAPAASAAPALAAGNVSAMVETTVPVPITISGAPGVSALQFDVTFDAATFASASVQGGPALAGHNLVANLIANNQLRVLIYSPTNGPIANGIVAQLPFIIASAAPVGSSPIAVSNVIFSDNHGVRIAAGPSVNGSITVSPGEPARLEALMRAFNGDISFLLTGVPGQSYILQRSSDLSNWSPFSTNVVVNGSLQIFDPNPAVPLRFYRAKEGQ